MPHAAAARLMRLRHEAGSGTPDTGRFFFLKMTKFSKMFDTLIFCCTNLVHSQHLTKTQHWYIKRIFLGTGTGEPSGFKPDGLAARNRIGAARPVNRP